MENNVKLTWGDLKSNHFLVRKGQEGVEGKTEFEGVESVTDFWMVWHLKLVFPEEAGILVTKFGMGLPLSVSCL